MTTLPPRLAQLPQRAHDDLIVVQATTALSRLRGLAGLKEAEIAQNVALELRPCATIHTFGMRFVIDLVWLDAADYVLRVDEHVKPRRQRYARRARAVIETHVGQGERFAAYYMAATDD